MAASVNWRELEREISNAVKSERRPVAVSFLDQEPARMKKFEGSEPSSCSFWRLAADGHVFYTVPDDHFNCPVGAYTHNIALSPEREKETQQTLTMMFDLGYVKPEEVLKIPQLAKSPKAIAYSPLGDTADTPDVVLFRLRPASAMMLQEAAQRAGLGSGAPALGRPTCMALPATIQHGSLISLGCIGNRVYTGLGQDELYVVLRGKDLTAVVEALRTIRAANLALQDYANARRAQLATS